MQNTRESIEKFLQLKKISVVGVSRNKDKFGNMLYRELKNSGYQVMAVNPNADMVEGDRCYAGLGALPVKPEGVVVVVTPAEALQVVEEAAGLGITHIWLQPGASSRETDQKCEELNLNWISGECLFMYLEPVKSVHAFHRFIRRLLGRMPK
ncbi:MAG TPA: CoA-binding protein [Anaerolineaceae bacterium]|jgi:predicted CoA-binding protein|nr:CoA-binding protein [Chloroflexota bacterium]HNS06461.1 CoA-binding protein [Anaerolineaceae bacterium]HNW14988.1 CoA-binding protein [Anaerolineaceae bacterium]HOE02057.1 CoA-binding protein [Anaerolineaceae bacterium]